MDEKHTGGSDERWNVAGLCLRCHLTLIRLGLLKVTGRAPNQLTWILGPRDVGLRVEGRHLTRGH